MRQCRSGPLGTLVVMVCFAVGVWLSFHHPLAPLAAVVLFVLWSAACYAWPSIAFVALPAVLPVAGLAPWSGWIVGEEFDLVVLGTAVGTYASIVFGVPVDFGARPSRIFRVATVLFLASVVASLAIGVVAVADTPVSLFAGYLDSLNSFRIAKAYCYAWLMLVPLRIELARSRDGSLPRLVTGLAVGLAIAAFAVLWERASYVGMLDFSSDYRVTGMFWEMHVGGAALDGFLALTMPFAVREWMRSRDPKTITISVFLIALGTYACIATFSRGVLVAVPLSMFALALLEVRRRRVSSDTPQGIQTLVPITMLIAATTVASWLAFRHGGYRVMIALAGVAALALPLTRAAQIMPATRRVAVGSAGACIAGVLLAGAIFVPKGPYALYGALLAITAFSAWRRSHGNIERVGSVGVAAFGGLIVASVGVAWHWGGTDALVECVIANILVVASVLLYAHTRPSNQRDDLRSWSAMLGTAILSSSLVAVFSGGAYMEGRMASSQADFDLRMAHWRRVIGLLDRPTSWAFGKGLGRFPSSYFFNVDNADFPGSFRLEESDGNRYLVLSGPGHPTGFGELFRISQRVTTLPHAIYTVTLLARAPRDVHVQFEVCEKHLLYSLGCATREVRLKGSIAWQKISVSLDGREIDGGPWFAPRLAFFSLAVTSVGQRVEVDDLQLSAAGGPTTLLANGDFSEEMAHWFFTSDREHLAWHAKSLVLNVLFDQGIVGLALFSLLVGAVLWRLCFVAYRHPDAPYLTSALVGFLIVGIFDSLLDIPRVAFLFYLLLFVAMILPNQKRPAAAEAGNGTPCRR